jgi:hypothetical protein
MPTFASDAISHRYLKQQSRPATGVRAFQSADAADAAPKYSSVTSGSSRVRSAGSISGAPLGQAFAVKRIPRTREREPASLSTDRSEGVRVELRADRVRTAEAIVGEGDYGALPVQRQLQPRTAGRGDPFHDYLNIEAQGFFKLAGPVFTRIAVRELETNLGQKGHALQPCAASAGSGCRR